MSHISLPQGTVVVVIKAPVGLKKICNQRIANPKRKPESETEAAQFSVKI